ncbi:amino acid adenylation domain-containing protein [Clostridium sporogenes]|uniref:Amino acid adenylation domain-containing protein n=1 Tax=Clostridium botulinum TaxID=1491 RepID=A0A6M0STR0_CLOBO|nr:non-ribosomal peptide synthetase [Clostridium sporogenes]NFA58889.1 amino acid adenylation domain-containing protein [Clostridium botulinum]NFI73472.1 amino acid adenylation domain-containing protein [Clostridium sporogenes]NFL71524.1 amino acid adenylation domain-containing protein [Clostridium sporogenes]NFM23331.1 amino acid adenylation domain-containing protein [Clostridium sporogenes]NFP61280.1 amino acid adenylation domain-containing protein [Clostridium sporogenes]
MEYTELRDQIKVKLVTLQEFNDNENLLKLGLNSLSIMRLVNQLRKKGIRVSYGELMQNPTLESWWNIIQIHEKNKSNKAEVVDEEKQIAKAETFKPFHLTDVQYAYKIGRTDIQELGGVGCHAYLEFLGKDVDPLRLEKAWNNLQYHNTMLRARFLEDGTQEIMDKPYDEHIIVKDLRYCADVEKSLAEIRECLSHRKLKVEEGQVAGITLSLLPDGKTMIHFDLDLLVADVQSLQILLRDLSLAYMGHSLSEDSKNWSFADYLERQNNDEKHEKQQAQEYWNNRLEELPFGPELPLEKESVEIKNVRFNRRTIKIQKDEWDILQQRVAENNATPAMLLLSSYAMILERWSRTKHFLINIPLFNRKTEYKGLEDVVADFTTLLLMEVDMRKKKTFLELLNTIQKQIHEDMKHTAYSGVQVQRDLIRLYGGKQNIAPVVFACNLGNPLITTDFKKNLGEFYYMISQTPGVCLDFQVYEDETGLMLAWDTVDELFPERMIDDMIHSLEECLHRLSKEDWNQYFDVLPQYQKEFIENQKNIEPLKEAECLYEAFLRNVRENPEKTAIIDTGENIKISYSELEKEALSIAAFIVKKKITKKPIAISLTRGYKQAAAALGILLSGNLYVPVSLNQPKERRKLIHKITGMHYAIADEKNFTSVEWPDETQVLKFEDLVKEEPLYELPQIYPEDSAYIIMTSGTTGFPKGAEMYHRGAYNTITDINQRFGITKEDSVLGVSSMDFDLSVYDLFGTFSSGGTLIMIPEERKRDAEFWMHQVMKYNITIWNSVPVLLDMLLVQAEAYNKKLPLKRVMLSGDWIGLDLPERVAKTTEDCKFIAMGGATEASIWSNYMEVGLPIPEKWSSIPYGRPLAHQSYRVVDEKGMDTPFLVEGELWIGGAGVGTYRGDDELVKKKFIKDASGIWYRTGDKGRFWNDGTIEFLGREDFQVKIRGHRIELGEIEATLKSIKDISKAVVESSDGSIGDKQLVAYLETNSKKDVPLYLKNEILQEKINRKWSVISNIDAQPCQEKEFDNALKYGEWKACKAMLEVLKTLDVFKSGKEYSYDEIMNHGSISATQKKALCCWLEALIHYGFIKEVKGLYFVSENVDEIQVEMNTDLKKIDSYIDRLKPYLPELLQGIKNPIEVYYAENKELSPNNLLEQLPGIEDTTNALINQIQKLLENSHEKIRILEVGTRDIKITKMILDSLKDKNIEYIYTDSSVFFINEGKELLESYPFVKFEVLDLEKEEFMSETEYEYDCIIAVNSIHRMNNLDTALKNIKKLLLSDGTLIMLELTIQTYLKDITATILEGGKECERESSILDHKQWRRVLEGNEFDKVCVYPEDATLSGRNVFIVMSQEPVYILNNEYISTSISEKLPEYMIPKVYHALEKLPLSKNGKIDRKALRALSTKKVEVSLKEEPSTETEKQLRNIWRETFKIEEIGVLDNYYLLGGDSLIATRMLTKVRDKFKVAFSIKDLMGLKTIKEQARRIDELLRIDEKVEIQELPTITPDKENENEPFKLTEVQQAYWIGRSGMYDLGQVSTHCYFELDGENIDIAKLQASWNDMIKQHGMMRVIILKSGKQQILKTVPEYQIPTMNLEELENDVVKNQLEKIRLEMSHQVIITETWPLFDVRATVMKDRKTRIHVSFDNLIFDGWSMFYLLNELAKRYRDEFDEIPKLEISFRDYVLGLEKIKNLGAYQKDKEYWLGRIDNFASAPELPLAKNENEVTKQKFTRRTTYLNQHEWESLKNSAKQHGITPAVLLITAYTEVLRRWSNNVDFTLNLTQFDRKPLHPQVNDLVGDFTTLTLLEVKNSKEDNFIKRAEIVQTQLMEDLEHTFYSAVEVQRELKRKDGNTKGSIMPIVFTSGLGIDQWNEGKWIGKLVYNISQTPQVWLDHQVVERDGGLGLFWDSVDELFYPGMLDEMFKAYTGLLKDLAAHKERFTQESTSLVNVPISEARKNANETERSFPDKSLDELFLEMEKKLPEKIAVVNKEYRLTYREVKEKSLYLCRQLQEVHIEKEELVAVLMEKSWEQIISVFGILFAGAAYLPLDIQNPRERLEKILTDSKTKNILVKKEFLEENEWLRRWNCIVVDGEGVEEDTSIIVKKNTDSLAYTIYTSGSTGMPKGVMISHKAAVNTILDINSRFNVDENDVSLAVSNLHFDLSVYDIFGILGSGGKLVIPDSYKTKDPEHWIELMNEEGITVWNSVPTFVEMLVEYEAHQNKLLRKDLRLIMISGDWIATLLPDRIRNIFGDLTIISMGGATEASIWSNIFEITEKIPEDWTSIPYGKPLSNQKYYILNSVLKNCPDWVTGMLYISGAGLAKGYLNDTEKTAEKFIYHSEIGEELYCTGDMGRYWTDGNIQFLGRADNQIKVNGYRVELGEIESALIKLQGVNKAVAMPILSNDMVSIVAFVECQDELDDSAVKEELRSLIPEYEIPKQIIKLSLLPLSNNGKIDRKALNEILKQQKIDEAEDKILLPRTEMEENLSTFVGKILGVNIGVQRGFFANGGDSLKAVRLVNLLKEELNCDVSLRDLYKYSTVEKLAKFIEEQQEDFEEGTL